MVTVNDLRSRSIVNENNVSAVLGNIFEMRKFDTEWVSRIKRSYFLLFGFIQDSSIAMNIMVMRNSAPCFCRKNLGGREGYMKIKKIPMDLLVNTG